MWNMSTLFHQLYELLVYVRLCGVIPDEIFDLPHIVTIALSLNCFHGTLPLAMCGAKELLVLAMDGLGVAKECQTGLRIPFSGALLWNTLEGSIPACLWSLPHIELLHLSGNGLTGTISSEIPNNSTLKDLSLGVFVLKALKKLKCLNYPTFTVVRCCM